MGKAQGDPTQSSFWVTEVIQFTFTIIGGVVMAYMASSLLDPNREERRQKREYKQRLFKRIGRTLHLSQMELLLTDTVLNPRDIEIGEEDIFGMEDILNNVRTKVMRPLTMREVYNTTLWRQPRGVLLHGPPGTGKTMLAKVVAKTCGCFFMSVSSANIMSKWYGDAQKLVRAIFSLACKLEPCIIFIDEVDSFLMARGGASEHEATLGIKTEFMQCWEGVCTDSNAKVLVMGATNRRFSLDAAVLRRFTMQQEIPLPNERQRVKILEGYLRKHMQETDIEMVDKTSSWPILSPEPVEHGMSALEWVAKHAEQYSGSDLHELCAEAAKHPLSEILEKIDERNGEDCHPMRPVSLADFQLALNLVKPVASQAQEQQAMPRSLIHAIMEAAMAGNNEGPSDPSGSDKEGRKDKGSDPI